MYVVALTGGIAAGKSTVAELWASLGAVHIDADQLARAAVAPKTEGLKAVTDAFGTEVLTSSGELDRSKLASVVFADSAKRERLEAIVHPIVQSLARAQMEALPNDAIVVYSIPLLAETGGGALDFDRIVSVEAPTERQISRLMGSRGMSRHDAEARIAVQATPAQRANYADDIINSNQELPLMLNDARLLWGKIQNAAAKKREVME